jgi:hypothetical protein
MKAGNKEQTTMDTPRPTAVDVDRAKQIWADYQKRHDVSDRLGQAVGIDLVSGRVWFGSSALDISRQLDEEGLDRPLYFVRVGYDYYIRKGGHR